MQPHPSFGSPFAKLHQRELKALSLSNPHPKPQPHPRSWLLAEPSQHQQPCLKEKKLSKETFCNLPCPWAAHGGVWGFLKVSWRLWSPPKAHRDLPVHQKARGELWGTPEGKSMPVRTQKAKRMAFGCTKSQVKGS